MDVVGGNELRPGFFCKFNQSFVDNLLIFKIEVRLYLQIKIFFAENFLILAEQFFRKLHFLISYGSGNFSVETPGKGNKAASVFAKNGFVHSWFIIKSLQVGYGN